MRLGDGCHDFLVRIEGERLLKVFVIHRFHDRTIAEKNLGLLAKRLSLDIDFFFLSSANDGKWKQKAEKAILSSEAIVIYDTNACAKSSNSSWEIDFATRENRKIIAISDYDNDIVRVESDILSIYHFKNEFDNCFLDNSNALELYKLMIDSSVKLMQRRQTTNTFFITIIGILISMAGFLFQTQTVDSNTIFILYAFSAIGLLLCKSWHSLIDNYGKLNGAKFDVILRLEQQLGSKIYSAEWIALGKGIRSQKYKSFTSTEKRVPLYFSILIAILSLALTLWYWINLQ